MWSSQVTDETCSVGLLVSWLTLTSVSHITSRSLPCQGGHDGTVARGPRTWWSSLKCIWWQSNIFTFVWHIKSKITSHTAQSTSTWAAPPAAEFFLWRMAPYSLLIGPHKDSWILIGAQLRILLVGTEITTFSLVGQKYRQIMYKTAYNFVLTLSLSRIRQKD